MKSANIMIRLLAGMLAAMTVFSVVACGKTDEPSETTTAPVGEVTTDAATEVTTAAPVETAPTHDANGYLLDDIPEQNHGGQNEGDHILLHAAAPPFLVPKRRMGV